MRSLSQRGELLYRFDKKIHEAGWQRMSSGNYCPLCVFATRQMKAICEGRFQDIA
jgi:hypothetical protein